MKVGDIVDGYCLISEIKGGGMSQVFVVEKDKSRYALKTPKAGAPDEFIKRFVREVRIMNQIDNDHVLKIIECNTTAVEPYYIMPLCESTLDNEIPRMNHTERLQVCKEFTIGINAIHSMGIRHRDTPCGSAAPGAPSCHATKSSKDF